MNNSVSNSSSASNHSASNLPDDNPYAAPQSQGEAPHETASQVRLGCFAQLAGLVVIVIAFVVLGQMTEGFFPLAWTGAVAIGGFAMFNAAAYSDGHPLDSSQRKSLMWRTAFVSSLIFLAPVFAFIVVHLMVYLSEVFAG